MPIAEPEAGVDDAVRPYPISISQGALEDLALRLDLTRWPEPETEPGWNQGVPLAEMKALVAHWRGRYDWRRCEAELNSRGSSMTRIDGIDIHFLHVRSPKPSARPLILTHGWPGSVVEFLKVIEPLSDPVRHGGTAADAFHLVIPSIPGYGFSGKPEATGWTTSRIARAWAVLMERLGYTGYIAQGGDWGAGISQHMGAQAPPGLAAIHLNMPLGFPNEAERAALSPEESAIMARNNEHRAKGRAYSDMQRTKPQTLGYGLADSPVGQAAWIYEKFYFWTDCAGHPTNVLSYDELLDNIMLYWLTDSGASSARLYHESLASFGGSPVLTPVGASSFPKEIMRTARRWAERTYPDLIYWNDLLRGGHFAAFEQPALFVEELRAFRRVLTAREAR